MPHILLECPVHDRLWQDLEHELDVKLDIVIIKELKSGKSRDKFLQFCEEITKKVVARNKTQL